jgi:DNA polymerase III delta subunit
MIILLYGPDDYRREQKKRELVAEFEKKHAGTSVGRFDLLDEGELEQLETFLRNQSIFEPDKLAVVTHAFEVSGKQLTAVLAPAAKQPKTTVLVTEGKKPTKEFDFLAKKPALVQEFKFLEGPAWRAFVKRTAKEVGAAIDDDATTLFAAVYEKDTWRLVTELQKSACSGKPLYRRDLGHLEAELAPDFWELLYRLKSTRLSDRLAALEECFAMNEPAAKIFNIIAYQWPEKLQAIAEYDRLIKSGKVEYEEALLGLVL